ncbi:MAG: aspartate/glutamate racemase family protein [Acidobacteria bacterium]|nr:aspartate/glutamate racemase family protein [Acidobacteriota bacterium]
MRSLPDLLGGKDDWRVVITDSGLGGLSICAELEKRLRGATGNRAIRLVYVNAWPDSRHGYNDLPDAASRAAVLDKALAAMTAFRPGLILIACNTLSVLYELTEFSRAPAVPVAGIIEEGVDLFHRALTREPEGTLVLFGTRTTIESGEHLRRLTRRGIDARRVFAAACHGLAGAVDKDPDSPGLADLVEECVSRAIKGMKVDGSLYAGLCCTHYSYIADIFQTALARRTGARVEILDPNEHFVRSLTSGMEGVRPEGSEADIAVEVVSKVELGEAQRRAVARRLEPMSARTARALIEYTRIPELF